MEIIWQTDLLPSSPHLTISMVLGYQPHTCWDFCLYAAKCVMQCAVWEACSQILHRNLYLQSLHDHLRWGRCLEGCLPDLCVQPEKVRLGGRCECSAAQIQARYTSRVNRRESNRQHEWWSVKEKGTDSPSSSVPVVLKVFSLLL